MFSAGLIALLDQRACGDIHRGDRLARRFSGW
jgi:hypothetical protein